MRLSIRAYRWLLKLYPAGFREAYGTPLERQFKDDVAEVRGVRAVVGLWSATLLDLARSVPRQLGREMGQDARHTLRLWSRSPQHTISTIAVLAIAIGAN